MCIDEHEQAVEKFLREHDPLYTAKGNLSNNQKRQCMHMDGIVFDNMGK